MSNAIRPTSLAGVPRGPGSTTLLQSVSQPVAQSVVGPVAQQSARNESSDRIIIFF
jgi:hypothetical protein